LGHLVIGTHRLFFHLVVDLPHLVLCSE
jgi:hypothetical protein